VSNDIGWFVVSPGGNALAGPFETEAKGKHAAQTGSVPGDIKVAVKFGEVDGWKFKALDPKQRGANAAEAGRGQSVRDVKEAVHRVGGEASKRGAPEERARAFDKVNQKTGARPNRSVIAKLDKAKSQDQDYAATDISEEEDYTMVLVVGGSTEPYTAKGEEYYGVNVLFYPDGKISASTADSAADWQWKHHKAEIIAAAKKALKKHGIKIGESKLTFKEFLLTEAKAKQLMVPYPYGAGKLSPVKRGEMLVDTDGNEHEFQGVADDGKHVCVSRGGKTREMSPSVFGGKISEAVAPKFKVGDEVTVPASTGDAYGEKGVITQMMGDKAKVKFDKYTKDVQVRHLRACVEEASDKDRLAKQDVEKIIKAKAELAKARKAVQADPECPKCKAAFEAAKKKLAALTA
jgi:hypothetical protein